MFFSHIRVGEFEGKRWYIFVAVVPGPAHGFVSYRIRFRSETMDSSMQARAACDSPVDAYRMTMMMAFY